MFSRFSTAFDTLFKMQNALEASLNTDFFGFDTMERGSNFRINLFENDSDLVLIAEIPGIKKEEVKIEVRDNMIRLYGQRSIEYPEESVVHRAERHSIKFDRTLELPIKVDTDQVKAEYRDGILKISLPRAEADKPRRIAVA